MKAMKRAFLIGGALLGVGFGILFMGCPPKKATVGSEDAARAVYVPPGQYDEFYAFVSGGFDGQLLVYGLPSGRLLKVIPVFSQYPRNGYGYSEETKNFLMTSHGFIPWGDLHHPELSQTDGVPDGRWVFANENNTPRVARIDLRRFETAEIIEIPNSAGNHSSPFITQNTEYVVTGTRFSVPIDVTTGKFKDVPIASYKDNFRGTITFIKVNNDPNYKGEDRMSIGFQLLVPGFDYDLAHCGKGPSHGWCFFTSYNTEEANTQLETNASQNDKDYILAVNWKKAEECIAQGKGKKFPATYYHNYYDEKKHMAVSRVEKEVTILTPQDCPGVAYYLPTPKSPHGVDVDPTGEYIVAGGKLSADLPIHSFSKMMKAIENKEFEKEIFGIPVLKFEAVNHCLVPKACLGPLHTEFDGKGYGYTSCFVSSEVIKTDLKNCQVVDRIQVYYNIGHLMIPGGDSRKPWGKYLLAMNKITKDRYLPVGPELHQSAQLIDISGEKMRILLDFPTLGEPHYANGIPADVIKGKVLQYYDLRENEHPYAVKSEAETRVERKGNIVHVYMSAIRSHFTPDNIEGIKVGDTVYFHVTNLEQEYDIPHGFALLGAENANILIMPGETRTIKWVPKEPGVYPFYCTDFCSPLHQEMQGYVRVSPANANVPLKWGTGKQL